MRKESLAEKLLAIPSLLGVGYLPRLYSFGCGVMQHSLLFMAQTGLKALEIKLRNAQGRSQ